MKETNDRIDVIEQCLNLSLLDDRHRQGIINKVTVKLLLEGYPEGKALSMFFWELADLEPPVTNEEQMFFRTLHRMFHTCGEIKINCREAAFEALKIPKERLDLPPEELVKEAKIAYWEQFNNLARDPKSLFLNAREIALKKKAFSFLQQNIPPAGV